MSKNVLMNEYKALAKEKWVEIEVRHSLSNLEKFTDLYVAR
jgi:hypothetical protein